MEFKSVKFPGETLTYITPTWDNLNQLAFDISKQILANGQKIDRIITLAKGGWPMTRSLVDFLEIQEVASIGVKFYGGINQRLDKPEIYQDLPVSIIGENILLFDDVADTGESLLFVKDYLHSLGVEGITTATLFYKPHAKIKPDYFGAETSAWIIFPYDMHCDGIHVLSKKWQEVGLPQSDIINRFQTLGFKQEWIEYFMSEAHIRQKA